jgi:hypothetical protein
MCAKASTVLRAVTADFFFNCWYLEIPSDNGIRHVPRCVHYHAQSFRLEALWDNYDGSGSRNTELYSLSADWFEYLTNEYIKICNEGSAWPTRYSDGLSARRTGFDSRSYQIF